MGGYTPNGIFYKPDIGASGATEKGKFDDGLNAADALIEANKPENNKLSAFAPTTSEELASVITDKLGAGKLRFDSSVTVISGATTLTPAQAGWIGVTASAPYTLTLPDPTGLKGLFYRVKKVDYNYNLITVVAVSGQFYYTNDEGVVKTTYNRLNTGGAEALFVTDGINWYVFNEELGQIPTCKAYMTVAQNNIKDSASVLVQLDAVEWDVGNNFNNSTWVSGTATSTSAGHLIDSAGAFTSGMVGVRVKNTTDGTETYITVVNSATDVTVRDDIFTSGKAYEIENSKFVVPVPGRYMVVGSIAYGIVIAADKRYFTRLNKNANIAWQVGYHSSHDKSIYTQGSGIVSCVKNDELTLKAFITAGAETIDLAYGLDKDYGFMQVRLISKD